MTEYKLKIYKGFARNNFEGNFEGKGISYSSHFSIDIFYQLIDDKLICNYELMIMDEKPIELKILNYFNAINILNFGKIDSKNIEKLVRGIKHEECILNDLKEEFQKFLRKNIGNFKYIDLNREIEYINKSPLKEEITELLKKKEMLTVNHIIS